MSLNDDNLSPSGGQKSEVNRFGMKLIAAVILIVIFISAFLILYFTLYPPITPDKQPAQGEVKAVERALSEGRRMDLASPDRRSWVSGDSGIFTLVVINRYNTPENFYIRVLLEDLGAELEGISVADLADTTSNWFTFSDSISLDPDAREAVALNMKIPEGTSKGSYKFRVLVCDKPVCELKTDSIYDSTSISLYVLG